MFAQEIPGTENIDDRFGTVVEGESHLYSAFKDQADGIRGMVYVENDLTFAKADGGFSRKVPQGVLGLASGGILAGNFHSIPNLVTAVSPAGSGQTQGWIRQPFQADTGAQTVKTECECSYGNG